MEEDIWFVINLEPGVSPVVCQRLVIGLSGRPAADKKTLGTRLVCHRLKFNYS